MDLDKLINRLQSIRDVEGDGTVCIVVDDIIKSEFSINVYHDLSGVMVELDSDW